MVDELLDALLFADIEIPGIAWRVTAGFRGILHRDQFGRAGANRQFLHTLIGHGGTGVPIGMEREQKPVIIVDESGFDFVLHLVRLAAELRAVIGDLNLLPVLGSHSHL